MTIRWFRGIGDFKKIDMLKRIDIDENGNLVIDKVPQTPQTGGGNQEMVLVVKDYFEGSTNITKTYTTSMVGFEITNDGTSQLTFTINGMTIPVKASEVYADNFEPYTTVTITTTSPYRCTVTTPMNGLSPDTVAPNDVKGLVANNVQQNSLTLSWSASTSTDTVGYDIYQGSTLLTTVTGTNYTVTNLLASNSYTFTIKAKDGSGNISTGVSITTNTATPDTTAPNEVTNLTTSNVTATSLTLSWTASSSTDIASYQIYQGSTLLSTVTGTSYSVSGLSVSTQYTFTVKAKDVSNNISNGVSTTVTTSNVADTTSPNPITNLAVGTVTSSSIPVTWTLSTSTDVANYEVAYSTDNGVNYTIASNQVNSSSTSYTINGLSASTAYVVRVVAIDGAGNRSTDVTVNATTSAVADTTPPNDVTNLTTSNVTDTSLTLTWTASNSTDIASYDVYNGATLLGNTTNTTYNVTGLVASTSYTFKVVSKDTSGNASTGVTVSATTTATPDTTPPTVTASPVGGTYTSAQTVTLTGSDNSGGAVTIYYTTDGTTPTISSSVYSTPISINATTTLKYFGVDGTGNQSSVQSQIYTINVATGNIITVDANNYLDMPLIQYKWAINSSFSDSTYTTIINDVAFSSLFDNSAVTTTVKLANVSYVSYSSFGTTNSECFTINGGKIYLKTLATNGTTAIDVMNHFQNTYGNIKVKLSSTYKTFTVPSTVSGTTTRTAVSGYEYFKSTLTNGIGSYTPTTSLNTQFASNGYEVYTPYSWTYTDPMGGNNSNIKVNSDNTIEIQLPSGTLTSIDDAGVSSYLANSNIIIYYA